MNKKGLFFYLVPELCIALLLATTSCRTANITTNPQQKRTSSLFPKGYKTLYKAISTRNASKILTFTQSQNLLVRSQAWRALHATNISTNKLINAIPEKDNYLAWFALSGHHLKDSQLKRLEKRWLRHPADRSGISLVLGTQGNKQTLQFLFKHLNQAQNNRAEYNTAMGISRLMLTHRASRQQYGRMIHFALNAEKPADQQAYLYAFYRSKKNWMTPPLIQVIRTEWNKKHNHWSRLTREMIVHILAKDKTPQLWHLLQPNNLHAMDINMNIEVARDLRFYPINKQTTPYYIQLLDNTNPRVVDEVLQTLAEKNISNSLLFKRLSRLMDHTKEEHPRLYINAMQLVARDQPNIITSNKYYLIKTIKRHPYLSDLALRSLKKTMKHEDYIKYLMLQVLNNDIRVATSALEILHDEWTHMNNNEKSLWKKPYHTVILQVLNKADRGLTATVAPTLSDSLLFTQKDFAVLRKTLNKLSLPGDIEVYEAIAPVLWKTMGKQGRSELDSLANLRYPPLNRHLKDMGVTDVPAGNYQKFPLTQPNWQLLDKYGRTPTWVLNTNKGTIVIKMDALRCPATVSAIIKLTNHHKYDGIPFHRVVDNFVIQGGDYEREDGYGGANFTLPTEPSEEAFIRGAVGIASAGTDTEGPQYFIMHQWAPHLNGHYTLFGHVIKGMTTVDQIVEGDKVTRAYSSH